MRIMVISAALLMLALNSCQKQPGDADTTSNTQIPPVVTPGLTSSSTETRVVPVGPALGQAMDATGSLRMDVLEAVRSGGVLTVKTRFTLVGGKPGNYSLPGTSGNLVYLTAGDKKFMMLKDDRDEMLMSSNLYRDFDQVGTSQTWWGKFPASSAEVKAVNFYFYGFDPVENVAITDR